jgi:glycosyltransferase involved in cell wall biosynthesis
MKVLIISSQPPSPFSGGEIRLLNLLKHLAGDYDFTVIAPLFGRDESGLAHAGRYCRFLPVFLPEGIPQRSRLYWRLNAWRQAFLIREPHAVTALSSPLFQSAVDNLVCSETFDVVQVQQLHMVQYLPAGFDCPTVLDVDNLWSKLWQRMIEIAPERRFTRRVLAAIDYRKRCTYEKSAVQKFDACLAVCQEDEVFIRTLAPQVMTAVVPNGVDTSYYVPQVTGQAERSLLFTGTMGWRANIDAVKFFVNDVFPIVQQYDPSTIFRIVGRDPTQDVRELAQSPTIDVTGFVEDVRPYMAESAVYVVPLRAGAGTRLKILEGLAMGKAVVSTSLGAEGLEVTDGENVLIADEPSEFATKVIRLLRDQGLREKLGRNGRRLVESRYDWSVIAPKLGEVYESLQP